MIRVLIKLNGIITNSGLFNSQTEAEHWINESRSVFPIGYSLEIVDVTDELNTAANNLKARQYLNNTDWYVIRELETGIQCPADIKAARTIARTQVI